MSNRQVIGMDGWRGGWVVVALAGGSFARAATFPTAAEAVAAYPDAVASGVDMPIGLPAAGHRRADLEARARLGARRSTLFVVPPRDVLEHDGYAAANLFCQERHGFGISRQVYALRTKILEMDALARSDGRLYEVHPELSFNEMAGQPLPSKRTWTGLARRRELLEAVGIDLPVDLGEAGAVPPDDVVDAAAAAWTADRIAREVAEPIPEEVERDGHGLRMAIWV